MTSRLLLSALFAASGLVASDAVLRGRVLDAETGQPVPCTVAIRTANGPAVTDHPSFHGGLRSTGTFEKRVTPGRVSVTASRGFDYAAQRQEFELRAGDVRDIEFRLKRRTPLRRLGWHAGDSHVHMIHGERTVQVSFGFIALSARAEGLDYLSVAQHWNLATPTPEALDAACRHASTPDFLLTWNLEAPKNYWKGDVSHCAGHGWTLGLRGRMAGGRDAIQELLAMSAWDYESEKAPFPNFESHALIRALGGMVAYTHPHRWWWGKWGGQGGYPVEEKKAISNMAQELPFDTVAGPTYDAIDIMMQPTERETNRRAMELWFMLLNHGYRIPATASSDTTFDRPGGGVPGKSRVYARLAGSATAAGLARAVREGRSFVTSGPLVLFDIGGREPGGVFRGTAGRKLAAHIRAWPAGEIGERLMRVELIRNATVVRAWEPAGQAREEFSATAEIEEGGTAWYAVRCFGSKQGQVAVTNPVHFEGPGYRPVAPAMAHVSGIVTDDAGNPLDATLTVVTMDGRNAVKTRQVVRAKSGRFQAVIPATARLEAAATGWEPQLKSVFMDSPALLDGMKNMTAGRLSDWGTFETVRRELENVRLDYRLRRAR